MNRKIGNPSVINGGLYYGDFVQVNLTGNTNDLVIPDLQNYVIVEITSTGNYNLTGIAPFDIALAWEIKVFNFGTNNIIFRDSDAGSIANNRFLIGGNKTIQSGEGISLTYRPLINRWGSTGINL